MNIAKSINKSIALLLFSLLIFCWLFHVTYDVPRILGAILGYIFVLLFFELYNFSLTDIGLSKKYLVSGLKLGSLFAGLAVVILLGTFILSPEIFRDDRYNKSILEIIFYCLIALPFLTVLFEELLFRGIMLSLFLKKFNQLWSIVFTSLAFGLWHFLSAQNINSAPDIAPSVLVIIGTLIFATVGGAFLSWLRLSSKSLLAPIIFHWIINATAVALAFLSWHY